VRVGTRLLLAVTPAIVGIAAVAALAYWGQYERRAPVEVVVVAVLASVASLVLAWRSTRYVATRVERIASRVEEARGERDELDAIERSVDGLAIAQREIRAGGAEREAAAQRAADLGARLDETIAALAEGVQAVQLPLHILLDSPFGTLNENQEEMLEAARGAAEALDVRLRQTRKLLDVERGALPGIRKPVGLGELLRPALAIAEAHAAKRGVALRTEVSPAARRANVDPMQTQEAVTILLREAIDRAEAGAELVAAAEDGDDGRVRLTLRGGPSLAQPTLGLRLAEALIRAQGGMLRMGENATVAELPAEQMRSARA